MIVTSDISPDKNLYFLGGKILEELNTGGEVDSLLVYEKLKLKYGIGFPLFMYALDWLYLLEVIELNKKGNVVLCT